MQKLALCSFLPSRPPPPGRLPPPCRLDCLCGFLCSPAWPPPPFFLYSVLSLCIGAASPMPPSSPLAFPGPLPRLFWLFVCLVVTPLSLFSEGASLELIRTLRPRRGVFPSDPFISDLYSQHSYSLPSSVQSAQSILYVCMEC